MLPGLNQITAIKSLSMGHGASDTNDLNRHILEVPTAICHEK
jgi:hypothetical protein